MILTRKTKEDFEKWYIKKDVSDDEYYDIWNNSDMGIAFWDGTSTGTAHSFDITKKQSKILKVINYITKES